MTENTFRDEVRDWLNNNFSDEDKTAAEESDVFKAWIRRLADKRWLVPSWPKEYGGAELNFQDHIILMQELSAAGARLPYDNGGQSRNMIGPTLLEYGTDEQKKNVTYRALHKAKSGGARATANPARDLTWPACPPRPFSMVIIFVLNGQKIWTSGAQNADWIYVLVRTDANASKHDGISMVLVDMDPAWCHHQTHQADLRHLSLL